MNDVQHPHDPEEHECTDCGATFDLARQTYYADKCPDCYDEPDRDRHTLSCSNPECNSELPFEEMVASQKAAAYDERGPAYVCPDCTDYRWTPSRGI